jgi:hypothetical protein
MEKPGSTTQPEGIDMVCFHAGPWRCAIEPHWIVSSHATHQNDNNNDNNNVEKIQEITTWLGLPDPPSGTRQILTLRQSNPQQLAVSPPVELRNFDYSAIHPLPPLLAARCNLRGIKALAMDEHGPILIIEIAAATTTQG